LLERSFVHRARPYDDPGLTRHRAGRGFTYRDATARTVRDRATLARIRSLAIPPAWREVWIASDPDAHIQAVGRDARGRLQYRYHGEFRKRREAAKYERLREFCGALPRLRRRVDRDLRCDCLCRDTVAAVVVALLERGHLRIGYEEYTRNNRTYGATTLEDRHVRVHGRRIQIRYRGKAGVARELAVEDPTLATLVRRCRDLPGRRLFQYRAGEAVKPLTAAEVNRYLHETIGDDFSAKDFRTWAATIRCALRLAAEAPPASAAAAKRTITAVIREVAERLGHTPTVCRQSYVHPQVIDAYQRGALARCFTQALRRRGARDADLACLRAAERCVVKLLTG
jgi:DNA topoisomerase-1